MPITESDVFLSVSLDSLPTILSEYAFGSNHDKPVSEVSVDNLFNASEATTFNISGPAIIGRTERYDILAVLNHLIDKYFSDDTSGCQLQFASIDISERGCTVNISGACSHDDVFVQNITRQASGLDELPNPRIMRTASYYDFQIYLPHIQYYVRSVKLFIHADILSKTLHCTLYADAGAPTFMCFDYGTQDNTNRQLNDLTLNIYNDENENWNPIITSFYDLILDNFKIKNSMRYVNSLTLIQGLNANYEFDLRK